MDHKAEFQTLFDYDLWASLQWIEPAQTLNSTDVLVHIVDAQVIWFSRVTDTERWEPEAETLGEDIRKSVDAWQNFIRDAELGRMVSYHTLAGEPYDNLLSDIVRHVINHGTYHRGQLRGIAGERDAEFPETDLLRFLRTLRLGARG
jgi:uncharacterized damage-inducible protein DinB